MYEIEISENLNAHNVERLMFNAQVFDNNNQINSGIYVNPTIWDAIKKRVSTRVNLEAFNKLEAEFNAIVKKRFEQEL